MAEKPRRRSARSPSKSSGGASRSAGRRPPPTSAMAAPRKLASGLPQTVYAQASPRSVGGLSMFEAGNFITGDVVQNFMSEDEVIRTAAARLQAAGFELLQISPLTINIAGPPALYDSVFGTKLQPEERPVIKEHGEDTATFVETADSDMPGLINTDGTPFADVLEGVAIEEPRYFHQNIFPPPKAYWHLDVPGDVSLGVNADRAHRGGVTGRGIKVVMCDTGWFAHPFFAARGYRSSPVVLGPGTANAAADEVGHGTAESANAFAAAPDIDFTMVKMSFVNSIGSFNAAVGLSPHIISCSWGSSNQFGPLSAADQALAASIALAVASGIIVVFSAGNGHWGFPGQHPDVISAGGTFMRQDGTFQASNYSSGFASNIYPGRNVPDLTGLVGMLPRAAYIMLPLQAGDQIDVDLATSGTHPNGDETASNDGWAAISGTSAAAPQLAGVAALIRQACPKLTPAAVRSIMKSTARDVTSGTCHTNTGGHAAGPGPDLATGNGLVDANRAVLTAKIRCLGPIGPIRPEPISPITVSPIRPIIPIRPIQPIVPIVPIQPIRPIEPIIPIQPIRPIGPVILPGPEPPISPETAGGEPQPTLSAEDVAQIEQIILESETDLDL
jgi:subtilisin family serine protease